METLQQSFESTAEYFSGSECLLAVLSRTETEHFKQRYCWVDDDSQAKGMSLWTCVFQTLTRVILQIGRLNPLQGRRVDSGWW